jgi:hypothetical protein
MARITHQELESWEQQIQDIKNELAFAINEEDIEYINTAQEQLDKLEREVWEKKIEPEPIIETNKLIKVNDYKTNKTYYI